MDVKPNDNVSNTQVPCILKGNHRTSVKPHEDESALIPETVLATANEGKKWTEGLRVLNEPCINQ